MGKRKNKNVENKESKKQKIEEKIDALSSSQRRLSVKALASICGIFHLSSLQMLSGLLKPHENATKINFSIEVDLKDKFKKDDVEFVVEAMCECGFKNSKGFLHCKNNLKSVQALIAACDLTYTKYTSVWDTNGYSPQYARAMDLSVIYHWMRNEAFYTFANNGLFISSKEVTLYKSVKEKGDKVYMRKKKFPCQAIGSHYKGTFLWSSDNANNSKYPSTVKFSASMRKGFGTVHEIPEFKDVPENPNSPYIFDIEDPNGAEALRNTAITAELLHRGAIEKSRQIIQQEAAHPFPIDWHILARATKIGTSYLDVFLPDKDIENNFKELSKVPAFFGNKLEDAIFARHYVNSYHAVLYLAKRLGWKIVKNEPGTKKDTIHLVICPHEKNCSPTCHIRHITMKFSSTFLFTHSSYEVLGLGFGTPDVRYLEWRKKFWGPNNMIENILS